MKSEKLLISFGFVLISIIWGSTWFVIKIGLDSVPPFYAVAMRFTLAMAILFLILRARGERLPTDRTSLILYVTLAVFSYSFPFALVYWGEQYIPSGLASILFAVYPFVVAIGSHFFLANERLNMWKLLGISLGFLGVLLIFWNDIHWGEASTLGMIAILASTLMQGASLIVVKKLSKHITPTALTLGGMILGVFILYVIAYIFEDYHAIRFDVKGVGSILYLGTFGTVVTFLTYYWLLKRVEAVYLSLVTLVTPVLAVILGAVWLQETLASVVFTGAGMILLGIIIANGKDIITALRQHQKRIFS